MGVSLLRAATALLVLPIALVGCSGGSSSSPTDPAGTPIMEFSGTVTFQGSSAHDLILPDDSLLKVVLADLDILLFDTTQASSDNVRLGLGVGQRDEEGDCDLTASFVVTEGQLTIVRLSRDAYCLTVFDPGLLPEDALLGYRLSVELTS